CGGARLRSHSARRLCPYEAGLSQESTQLERIRWTTRAVLTLQPAELVPRLQPRICWIPKGERRGTVYDANHASRLQHPPHLLECLERSGQVLQDRARECCIE